MNRKEHAVTTELALFQRAATYGLRTAIIDAEGRHTYQELLDASARVAGALLDGADDLNEARVAFLVPPEFEYAAVLWGIWRAGGIAVPLCPRHPLPEIQYVIDDAQAAAIIADPLFVEMLRPLTSAGKPRLLATTEALGQRPGRLPQLDPARRAMILYTSGTTARPKGVVTTHANIAAQVETLVEAWEWTDDDHILHVLPLHHIHGIINALTCALWSGAVCEMLPKFDAQTVWSRLARAPSEPLSLFMAVPTIYSKLIGAWEAAATEQQADMSRGCRSLRLMVSGSAALPVETLERWREITGHTLLERYGMTEIGMALSNPLHGPRRAGCVGTPLPGVEVRLVDETGQVVSDGTPGEIEVRSPSVFLEYWDRPEATREAFRDGWFRTGDVAVVDAGSYRILGRSSFDIIKTGGYKVSALEIEEVLRCHGAIADCAVVGVDDPHWGQRVAAAVVLKSAETLLTLDDLRPWAKERLADYKIPTLLRLVLELPRNVMGKVSKPAVREMFDS
jgi:malonyl-CoA/methylmalonyl-CoA synthetase